MNLDDLGLRFRTDKASSGHDYLRHYERFLGEFRDSEFTLIEIGGLNGASLQMWREFFPKAQIVCIDINPEVKRFEGERITVEIGDSGSATFLQAIRAKYQSATVVLDDGSHRWHHQRRALKELFPMVEPGGYYIVEDIHTSYEQGFAGKDDLPFVFLLKQLVDYLNLRRENRTAFERTYNKNIVAIAQQIDFACFIPRCCVIRKRQAA